MFGTYTERAEFALDAVRIAARLCRRIQDEMVTQALSKSDRSPVTVADFASQAVVARMLQETYPMDVLVAEEDSSALRRPDHSQTLACVTSYVAQQHSDAKEELVCEWIERGTGTPDHLFWVLDPIDGTKGFLRGGQYVVALALIEAGKVVIGALGCPNLNQDLIPDVNGCGSSVIAVIGRGAWVSDLEGGALKRLRVSNRKDPTRARVLRSYESGHTDSSKIDQLMRILGTTDPPVLMDSQAKFAILASGGGELLFRLLAPERPDYVEKIWDQAAGSLVVEEAGGQVSDLRGTSLNFAHGRELTDNIGVLVSNGHLHHAALEALKAVKADRRPTSA